MKVSVVMPCYQSGETVERSVRSVQAQTMADWELIAVDDGSTDDTLARLRALQTDEPRMRVLHQDNAGVSAARNAGIDTARGEWLFFLDADDRLTPDALATLLDMADDALDVVCGAYEMRYADEGGRSERYACADGDLQTVLESLIRGDSALNSMCARLYRTAFIQQRGIRAPLGVKVGEDVLFNLDAFAAARAWRMSERVVYIYEFGGDSAMTRARQDVYARSRDMLDGITAFIAAHGWQTRLFRAHIDIYLRTLRADRGRLRAALAFDRRIVRAITDGVHPRELCAKQRLYDAALRLCPFLSIALP